MLSFVCSKQSYFIHIDPFEVCYHSLYLFQKGHLFSSMFCFSGIPLVIVGVSLGVTGKAGYGNEN